jgi:hypothetical protein
MSTFAPCRATCPHCTVTFDTEVVTSVSAHRTPGLREKVLEGSFGEQSCPGCGRTVVVIVPFPYVDFDRRHFIFVQPAELVGEWQDHEKLVDELFTENLSESPSWRARELSADFIVRTVFGIDELREKLLVFDADLDDGVIETVKLRHLLETSERWATPPIIRFVTCSGIAIEFTIRGTHTDGRETMESGVVPRRVYDAIAGGEATEILDALRSGTYCSVGRLLATAHTG